MRESYYDRFKSYHRDPIGWVEFVDDNGAATVSLNNGPTIETTGYEVTDVPQLESPRDQ